MKKILFAMLILSNLLYAQTFTPGAVQAIDNNANPLFRGIDLRKSNTISTPSVGIRFGNIGGKILLKDSTGKSLFIQNREVPVFVFIGESNSEGVALNSSATVEELNYRKNLNIWNVDSTKFSKLKIGQNNVWNDNIQFQTNKTIWHGWELELANRGLDRIGFSQIYVIKCGQGGSRVDEWDDITDTHYTKFAGRVTAAIEAINILGYTPKIYVMTSLGINDAIAGTNPNTFASRLTAFHANIRSLLGADIPIIQTQIMPNNANYIAINEKIIANSDNIRTFHVSVAGLTLKDANHWDYAGMKALLNRMLDICVDIIGLPNGQSGRSLVGASTSTTWELTSGNNVTLPTVSKTIIRPTSTTDIWSNAAFRIEAYNNTQKFGYGYYNTSTNRFVIGGATVNVSNDPVELAPLSTVYTKDVNVSGLLSSTNISNSNNLNVGGLTTTSQINATKGFFQLSTENGNSQNQAVLKFGNSGNLNSYGWMSHDNTDNITYFGSVHNGIAHTNIVLAPISPSMVGVGKKPSYTFDVNGITQATQFKISALNTAPANATDTGVLGEIRITSGHIYVCIATNTWVRATLSSF